MEQLRVEDALCLPKHFTIRASARVALFKVYRTDMDYTLSDYRRSPQESPKTGSAEQR